MHTDFDEQEQKFVGLPRQWQSLIEDTAKRPKPFIDATVITTVEPRKVSFLDVLHFFIWFTFKYINLLPPHALTLPLHSLIFITLLNVS